MKPSERIEQIAKEMVVENSTPFNPRETPTTVEYIFAIIEYLDEKESWWKRVFRK